MARKHKVLLIDNYDSFVYNIAQYLEELGASVIVKRNDAIGIEEAEKLGPSRLVISPGPGSPAQSGVSNLMIKYFADKIPILGVCLGHQCIGFVFGGHVTHADNIMHGKTSQVFHDGKGLFQSLPNPIEATRYHSLIVREKNLPAILEVSAYTKEGEVMGLRHKKYPIEGVQFHPESILTRDGKDILRNFLRLA